MKRQRKAFSSNAEILCKLANLHEMPTIIMEWRKLRHLISCYVDLLSLHSFYDDRFKMNRIYSTILQTSAPTGRLAMNCMSFLYFFIYLFIAFPVTNFSQIPICSQSPMKLHSPFLQHLS